MKRKIILPVVLLTGALAVGSLGIARVYAQDSGAYPTIIQKLAEKFNLNPNDVQDVFEEVHAEHHAQMLANFEERLSKSVEDGKITEDQKQKILNKQEEVQAKMEEWKDLTPDERREKMKSFHEEIKTWAEENDIDFPFMAFKFGGHGFGRGLKNGMMFEHKLD